MTVWSITRRSLLTASLALLAGLGARAGQVIWDAEQGCIRVMDYPEDVPATIDDLARADQTGGWGKVTRDPATDTCTVQAPVWIGIDRGLGTYFQLGRTNHPREILRVKGDVWVRPQRPSGLRPDGRPSVVNRLSLGHPDHPEIQSALKIICDKPGQYGLIIGDDQTKKPAELHVYNSVITADIPDWQHARAGHFWCSTDVRLVNAKMAWVKGSFMYGVQSHNSRIERSIFEYGGNVLMNGSQTTKDCVFRNIDTALSEGGCLDAVLTRCVFENNERNWTLGSSGSRGIDFIDCVLGAAKAPVKIHKNSNPRNPIQYPACTEWISLPVKVQDRRGRPVEQAFVNVRCREDSTAVKNGLAVTDRQGLTPGDPEHNAILIVKRRWQATDDPERPRQLTYLYAITVEAAGFKPAQAVLPSGQDIPRPWVVRLETPGWFAGFGRK